MYDTRTSGIHVQSGKTFSATGCQFANCHVWGSHEYAWKIEAGYVTLDNCVGEWASTAQVHLNEGDATITAGRFFGSNKFRHVGIEIGSPEVIVYGSQIDARMADLVGGALKFTNEGGSSKIKALIYQTKGVPYSGTPARGSLLELVVNGVEGGSATVFPKGPLSWNGGTPIVRHLSGTATWQPPEIPHGAMAGTTVTVAEACRTRETPWPWASRRASPSARCSSVRSARRTPWQSRCGTRRDERCISPPEPSGPIAGCINRRSETHLMTRLRSVEDARGWLETRLRAWVNQARGQGRTELDPSGIDIVKLHEKGRYREAEIAARRLVNSLRETCGDRHPQYATALSNLALSLQKQGDYAGAEPLLRQVLEVRRETLGEHHPHYATALNNIALLLCERGDLVSAETLMRQALDIRRESLGERHPDHATGLTSLAMLLCERRDLLRMQEPLLQQALDIRREILGEHHPHYATALNNLALLLRERGDYAGAEPLLRRALDIRRETQGEHHPDTLSCAHALESFRRAEPLEAGRPRGHESGPRTEPRAGRPGVT